MVSDEFVREKQTELKEAFIAKFGSGALREDGPSAGATRYAGPCVYGKITPARTKDADSIVADFKLWLDALSELGHEFQNVKVEFMTSSPTSLFEEIDRLRYGDTHIWLLTEWDDE